MKKLILVLFFISIFSLSSCKVTKTVIEIPEENSKEVLETNIPNEETKVYPPSNYINNKTDGTLYYFVQNSNADGFDIVEEKVNNIYEISLEDILKREIELNSAIPRETVIHSIKVENNIAYVDISSIFSEDPNTNSSNSAILKVYSIVNVLNLNRALEIDGVKFLIDGKDTEIVSILSNETFSVHSFTLIGKGRDQTLIPEENPNYINNKTDGTVHFFKANDNVDGFEVIEENISDIANVNLKELAEKAINLSTSSPKETKVNKVYIRNRVAYVDLNEVYFDDPQTNSSASSFMKIGSLTNLFCYNKFLEVDSVTFLKNGIIDEHIGQSYSRNLKGY